MLSFMRLTWRTRQLTIYLEGSHWEIHQGAEGYPARSSRISEWVVSPYRNQLDGTRHNQLTKVMKH